MYTVMFSVFHTQEKYSFGSVVMILANKQDIPGCLSQQEVEDAFRQKFPDPLEHHSKIQMKLLELIYVDESIK